MTLTLEASNGSDDRGRDQRPASHRSNLDDDTDNERGVTRMFALRRDDFFGSFGVVTDRER